MVQGWTRTELSRDEIKDQNDTGMEKDRRDKKEQELYGHGKGHERWKD
jgi:hypothetical protein